MKINFIRVLFFLIAIFVLSIFLFSLNKVNIYDTQNLIGQKIQNFEIKSFSEEKIINEKRLEENKYTLINFWASWCAPCRAEHKYLIKLKKNTKNLKMLGVNFKDKAKDASEFIEEFGNPYHISGKDPDGRSSVNFGIYGIPESILVDQNLTIVKKFIGPLNFEDYKEILNLTE